MNNENKHIDFFDLTVKYLSGEADKQEINNLEDIIKASANSKKQFIQYKRAWQLSASKNIVFNKAKVWEQITQKMDEEIHETPVVEIRPNNHRLIWRIAAGLIILLTAAFMLYQFVFQNKTTELLATNQVRTEKLADGTEVSLNQHSSLSWNRKFNKNERRVSLKGDAYFDVAKNPKKAFVIEAGSVEIKVLGTAFYVDAHSESDKIEVIVKRGTVAVTAAGNQQVTLQAGEMASFNKREEKLAKFQDRDKNVLSWKTKVMIFQDTPLAEVIQIIGKTYGVKVRLTNPDLAACRLTATFEKMPLDDVLNVVSETLSLAWNKTGSDYELSGEACQ